jgi:ferrous iron transport protein A
VQSLRKNFFSLGQLPSGSTGLVRELHGDTDFCQRVREMGFGESTFVTKIAGNGTILCQVRGTRLALSRNAAMNIIVERLPAPADSTTPRHGGRD